MLEAMSDWRKNCSFVLIDTRESGNIGASARALKNLGFSHLELVRPAVFPSDEAGWFAHGADDVLENATISTDLDSALSNKSIVIGVTRRVGKKRGNTFPIRESVQRIRSLAENNRIALLFGREDRGLTNTETERCAFMITIPANPDNPSFNLAQAVLLIAYELSHDDHPVHPMPQAIDHKELEQLFLRIVSLLKTAGYAPKGIRDEEHAIFATLRRLAARTAITPAEARMLHGILSQTEIALTKKHSS